MGVWVYEVTRPNASRLIPPPSPLPIRPSLTRSPRTNPRFVASAVHARSERGRGGGLVRDVGVPGDVQRADRRCVVSDFAGAAEGRVRNNRRRRSGATDRLEP